MVIRWSSSEAQDPFCKFAERPVPPASGTPEVDGSRNFRHCVRRRSRQALGVDCLENPKVVDIVADIRNLRAMSVAFDDHGEIVPNRGTTSRRTPSHVGGRGATSAPRPNVATRAQQPAATA